MSEILEDRKYLFESSNGKHICCTCIHATEVDGGNFIMTTMDYNSCDVMTGGGDPLDENYKGYKGKIKTEDNGGGYWITECEFYEYDRNWNEVKYHDYIKSDKWKAKRLECLKRDNYQCQKCGTATNLVIHHWTYDRLGNEDLGDIVTLCKECHKKVHHNDILQKAKKHGITVKED